MMNLFLFRLFVISFILLFSITYAAPSYLVRKLGKSNIPTIHTFKKLNCLGALSHFHHKGCAHPATPTVPIYQPPVFNQQPPPAPLPLPPPAPVVPRPGRGRYAKFNCGSVNSNNQYTQCRGCVRGCAGNFPGEACGTRGSRCFLCRDRCLGRFGIRARGPRRMPPQAPIPEPLPPPRPIAVPVIPIGAPGTPGGYHHPGFFGGVRG